MSDLPRKRRHETTRVRIGGMVAHVAVGPLGEAPREVFINLGKEGAPFAAVVQTCARLASCALQAGVPVGEVAHHLRALPFEPAGTAEVGDSVREVVSLLAAVADLLEEAARP